MKVLDYINSNNIRSPYLKYAKNIYTQNGEDGIIEKLLSELEITSGICVDIGSWDGVFISNIFNLWRYQGFNAVLIEANPEKAQECLNLVQNFDNVEVMNCLVSSNPNNEYFLESLLEQSNFDFNSDSFVLLNIDVDGEDYNIMKSINKFRPIIIVIETSTDYDAIEKKVVCGETFEWGVTGASIAALEELGTEMGYTLVCSTGNAFFVRNDYVSKLQEYDESLTTQDLYVGTPVVQKFLQKIDNNQDLIGPTDYYLTNEYKQMMLNEKKKMLESV